MVVYLISLYYNYGYCRREEAFEVMLEIQRERNLEFAIAAQHNSNSYGYNPSGQVREQQLRQELQNERYISISIMQD